MNLVSGEEEKIEVQDQPSAPLITTKIHPKKYLQFGRVLAFSIDEISIQMAAASHLSGQRKILDIQKVYIPLQRTGEKRTDIFISDTISGFVKKYGGRRPRINLTISSSETAYRVFFMPVLKKQELSSAITFEIKRQIPFPIEDCLYDYRVLLKIGDKDQQRYRVALLAATKKFIYDKLKIFHRLNIEVSQVYLAQDVVGMLLEELPDFDDDKHFTLVHVKRNNSEIAFYRGSSLEFFNISSTGSSMLGDGDSTRFAFFTESLATEIQTSLDYYTGQYSRNYTNQILLYGDLTYCDEIIDKLNKRTGFNFDKFPADKLQQITTDIESHEDLFSVSLPVLAACVCQFKLPNLLPYEDKIKITGRKSHLRARSCLYLLMFILAVGWYMLNQRTNVLNNDLNSMNLQIENFKNSKAFHAYNILKRQIATDRNYLDNTRELPSYLHLNLKELSHLTPKSIRLYNFDFNNETDGRNLTLQGLVTSKDIPPEVILAEYAETLASSPFYEDVSVVRHVKKNEDDRFIIEFAINLKGII